MFTLFELERGKMFNIYIRYMIYVYGKLTRNVAKMHQPQPCTLGLCILNLYQPMYHNVLPMYIAKPYTI